MATIRRVSRGIPTTEVSVSGIQDPVTRQAVDDILDIIRRLREHLGDIVNHNLVIYFDQNAAPTTADLEDGQMALWKDADAASSTPTHYLVIRDGSDILTFASEELVP